MPLAQPNCELAIEIMLLTHVCWETCQSLGVKAGLCAKKTYTALGQVTERLGGSQGGACEDGEGGLHGKLEAGRLAVAADVLEDVQTLRVE